MTLKETLSQQLAVRRWIPDYMERSTMSFSRDRIAQSGDGLPAIARFSVHGTEYMVVKSGEHECGQLAVVGTLEIDGQKFAVGRCSNVPTGRDALAALSPRELEIARCVAAGYQTKAIAQRLRISYYTVRVHIGRIYSKLGLHKQTELASWISANYGRQRIDCPPSAPMRQIGRAEEGEISGTS
jgi:DNA-binding CsgD family transcriptional regulator